MKRRVPIFDHREVGEELGARGEVGDQRRNSIEHHRRESAGDNPLRSRACLERAHPLRVGSSARARDLRGVGRRIGDPARQRQPREQPPDLEQPGRAIAAVQIVGLERGGLIQVTSSPKFSGWGSSTLRSGTSRNEPEVSPIPSRAARPPARRGSSCFIPAITAYLPVISAGRDRSSTASAGSRPPPARPRAHRRPATADQPDAENEPDPHGRGLYGTRASLGDAIRVVQDHEPRIRFQEERIRRLAETSAF